MKKIKKWRAGIAPNDPVIAGPTCPRRIRQQKLSDLNRVLGCKTKSGCTASVTCSFQLSSKLYLSLQQYESMSFRVCSG